MIKPTQQERVIEQLRMHGHVTNFWALDNYILRLASIISKMNKTGWVIETQYEHKVGKKNCKYILVKEPDPKTSTLW